MNSGNHFDENTLIANTVFQGSVINEVKFLIESDDTIPDMHKLNVTSASDDFHVFYNNNTQSVSFLHSDYSSNPENKATNVKNYVHDIEQSLKICN